MCNSIGYYYTSRGCDRGRPLDGGRSVKLREIGMMQAGRDEVKRQDICKVLLWPILYS